MRGLGRGKAAAAACGSGGEVQTGEAGGARVNGWCDEGVDAVWLARGVGGMGSAGVRMEVGCRWGGEAWRQGSRRGWGRSGGEAVCVGDGGEGVWGMGSVGGLLGERMRGNGVQETQGSDRVWCRVGLGGRQGRRAWLPAGLGSGCVRSGVKRGKLDCDCSTGAGSGPGLGWWSGG